MFPSTFSGLRSRLTAVLAAFLLVATCQSVFGQWQSMGTLQVPSHPYSFLAATPSGDLIAATFHKTPEGTPAKQIPVLLIKNPTSQNPTVSVLSQEGFVGQRGYSGVACDSKGNYYISGDTGEASTCFIRKYSADGKLDASFGKNGQISPMRRTLGIDALGDFLVSAYDWGSINVYDTQTGLLIGSTKPVNPAPYVRDVAIDPKSMRVFGVAAGGVVTWGAGAPWYPSNYQFRQISPEAGRVRAGEGISIDPIRRTVLVTPIPGNVLLEIEGSGRVNRYVIESADPSTHLADSVLSFDGETLFVSDILANKIHVMKRSLAQILPAIAAAPKTPESIASLPPVPGAAVAQPVQWFRSYTDIVRVARQQQKPMIVYFRSKDVQFCQTFENNVLLTDAFNQRAKNFVCVFEDAGMDRLMAYRFGVYRVPYIFLLDAKGETFAEFRHDMDTKELLKMMEQLNQGTLTGG